MSAQPKEILPVFDVDSVVGKTDEELQALRQRFSAQDEFLVCDEFVHGGILDECLRSLPGLESKVHRNFIPGHKKGGSVSRNNLSEGAPVFRDLYNAPDLLSSLEAIIGRELTLCPDDDPHAFALYYYTEPGDHIGFHYDTSYYRGARYTVLLGLVDDSSCVLDCELYRADPNRATESLQLKLQPGRMVVFNGDKVYHRITPAKENERRIALTMEFVTDPTMHPVRRFVSNMKDAIAYFGFKQVFGRS